MYILGKMDVQRGRNITLTPKPPKIVHEPTTNQGLASLIVMIAVLTIIILFCCFSAPGIRGLCKRYIFKTCTIDDPDLDNIYTRKYGYDIRDEVKEIREYKKKLSIKPQQ